MEMLEREMGINKFSIYSSFGSKKGLFLECIKIYRKETVAMLNKLKSSNNGVLGIKQYFYDYLVFTRGGIYCKGCFLVNTTDELGEKIDLENQQAAIAINDSVLSHSLSVISKKDQPVLFGKVKKELQNKWKDLFKNYFSS